MIRKFGGSTGVDIQPQGLDLGISGSNIKSVQRGTISMSSGTSATVTIAPVNVQSAIVKITYARISDGSNYGASYESFTAILTNSTTITISRYSATSNILRISWEVIEFNNVKSLQVINTTFLSNTQTNVTIAPVNISKTMLFPSFASTLAASLIAAINVDIILANSTTLTITPISIGSSYTAGTSVIQIIEFN